MKTGKPLEKLISLRVVGIGFKRQEDYAWWVRIIGAAMIGFATYNIHRVIFT